MIFSVIYWGVWRVVLPWLFKYELVPTKEVLKDGTVVTVVRSFNVISSPLGSHTCCPQYAHRRKTQ